MYVRNACFCDYKRYCSSIDKINHVPRWLKLKNKYCETAVHVKHCFMCCQGQPCVCNEISNWGHDNWFEIEGLNFWCNYLKYLGYYITSKSLTDQCICSYHYKQLRKYISSKKCLVCSKDGISTATGTLIGDVQSHPSRYNILCSMLDEVPCQTDWLCSTCYSVLSNESSIELIIDRGSLSSDPVIVHRAELLRSMISTLSKDGLILTTHYINKFKEKLQELQCNTACISKYVGTLKKLIDKVMTMRKGLSSYSLTGKPGKLYYDPLIFSEASLPFIFNVLSDKSACSNACGQLNTWIKEQIRLFPCNSSTFDYRTLVNDGEFNDNELSKYFHKDMSATASDRSKDHKVSDLYDFRRKLCIRMVISILCLAMNPSIHCIFSNFGRFGLLCIRFT